MQEVAWKREVNCTVSEKRLTDASMLNVNSITYKQIRGLPNYLLGHQNINIVINAALEVMTNEILLLNNYNFK